MSITAKNSLKLSLLTILSRILGLAREHYQAVFFGTGPIAFAWEMATLVPGFLRSLLVEGGVAQAFIPVYTSSLERSKKEAQHAAGIVLVCVFLIMTAATLLSAWAFPYILPVMTQQTGEPVTFMIQLTWILLLFMIPASLTAILSGISNAHNHFVMPALAPIVLNIGMLIGFWSLDALDAGEANARILAWFFVCTAVVQLIILYGYVLRNRFEPLPSLDFHHPTVRKIFYLVLPAVFSTAIFHVNHLADVAIASYFIPSEIGSVPALRFSHRLVLLPTGVIGVALSTAILPILARCLARKSGDSQKEVLDSFRFGLFLTVPAAIGFFFLGKDIIDLLFSGGKWDAHSTQITWDALRFYLFGIPLYSLNKVLIAVFFAFKDTKTPLRSMAVSTSCNLIMNLWFVQFMQHAGIALSTAITAGIHFTQLTFYLQKKHMKLNWISLWTFLKRSLVLWLLLGIFLFCVDVYFTEISIQIGQALAEYLGKEESVRYAVLPKVVLGAVGGFFLYIGTASFMDTKEIQILRSFFSKRR